MITILLNTKKNYLVTGGCGFIGSYLTHDLVQDGHQVIILDDLSSGSSSNCPTGATLIQGSILDVALLESLMDKVDGCFHLAAITSTQPYNEEWSHTVNTTGTMHVFSQARKHKIPVVYASSAAIYGHQKKLPIKENTHALPISSYGCDKYYCELRGNIAAVMHNIPTIGIRFFNVYGAIPGTLKPYSGVIPTFIHRALNQKDLMIFGDGSQLRDFLYINDAVLFLTTAMNKLHKEKEGNYVINACTGKEISIKEVAHHIIDLTGTHVKCVYRKPRKDDICESIGDPNLLKEILGIRPQTCIIDGLGQTISSMQNLTRGRAAR